jgi:hypothetical protein
MTPAAGARGPARGWAAAALGICAAAAALYPDKRATLAAGLLFLAIPFGLWLLAGPRRWVGAFFAAALLLPPLPVAIGDSGPHPAVVVAGLGILAGLAHLDGWRIRRSAEGAGLLALLAALAGSLPGAMLTAGPAVAAQSAARVLLFGTGVYVYFFESWGPDPDPRPWRTAKLMYWCAAASALFGMVDFYFQWTPPAGYGQQFVWTEAGVYRRAQGLFYEASTLGNLCAFFLAMIAVSLTRPRKEAPVSRAGLAVGAAVFVGALLLSFSRAAVVNVAVALAALLVLRRGEIRWRRFAWTLAPAAAVLGAAAYLLTDVVRLYGLRLWASGAYLFTETSGVLSGRLESWRLLARFLAENPWHWLIGVGYKTLPYSNAAGAPVVADNMYLSLLVETGIAGLGALLWLCAAILRAGYRAASSPDREASFFGTWIFCFWAGQMAQMLSGDLLTYWRVLPLYFWVLAMAGRR